MIKNLSLKKRYIFFIFILSYIFISTNIYATDICSYKNLRVVFKIKPDGSFVISSGESASFLGIKVPEEAGEFGVNEFVKYLNDNIFKQHVRLSCDSDLPGSLSIDNQSNYRVYVYLEDGTFLNAELIKKGYVIIDYSYGFKYQKEFEEYENQASEKKIGLWQIPSMQNLTWRSRKVSKDIEEKSVEKEIVIEEKKEQTIPAISPVESPKKDRLQKYLDLLQKGAKVKVDEIPLKKVDIEKKSQISEVKSKGKYVGHRKTKIYHHYKCEKIKWIKSEKDYFDSPEEAEKEGYIRDATCKDLK